jgi:ubiquinone/menaquinone biosynthesis C-methylase UbiE
VSFESRLRHRSADVYAAFFQERLGPSDRVLDCGCGEGSIAVGLAARAGRVVEIDRPAEQLEPAPRHDMLDAERLAELAAAWEAWAASPDAFFGFTWSRAIGWKAG